MTIFRYYYFDGFKVDVFGHDPETDRILYSVETDYSSKVRLAKKYFKEPDKRNPWHFWHGTYIYIIDPNGKKRRLCFD